MKPSSVMAWASTPELTPADDLVDAVAGFEQVDQDQPEGQRHQRGGDEPQHGFSADPPDGAGVRHVADADDEGGEDQRGDDHLDQAQEDRAADGDVAGEQLLGRRGGELVVDQAADGDAEHHRD